MSQRGNIKANKEHLGEEVGHQDQKYENLLNSYKEACLEHLTTDQCKHSIKISNLQEKLKKLLFIENQLLIENDLIVKGMQKSEIQEKKKNQETMKWKLKYENLKLQNDIKSKQLATLSTNSILKNNSILRNQDSSRTCRYSYGDMAKVKTQQVKYKQIEKSNRKSIDMDKYLTKQQKQYIKMLHEGRKQRCNSVKLIKQVDNNRQSKRYSAKLPDGLEIHIIDNRGR